MSDARTHRKGMSLVEMVAASTILSLGVVTVSTLSIKSVARVRENQAEETAWDILDRQLTTIDYVGVDAFLRAGQLSGTLGSESNPLGRYEWEAAVDEGAIDGLYTVTIVIRWGPEGRKRQIMASTVMSGTPTQVQTTQTGQGQQGGTGGGAQTSGSTGGSQTGGQTSGQGGRSGGGGR